MPILSRCSRVSGPARTPLGGVVEAVESAASTRQFAFHETKSDPHGNAEPVQEIVVVPLREVLAQLPAEALSQARFGGQSLVQVVPEMTVRETRGPIYFSVAAIQEVCPHLFRPGYRVHPEAMIQIPEEHVFLGYPRRPQLSSSLR